VVDPSLLEIARDQYGIVGRGHLRDAGFSASAIARLLERGVLEPVLPGVYRLASSPDTFLSRAVAAVTWSAGDGFLSSWTAGRLRGLRRMPSDRIHLTVPDRRARRSPDWIHLDRTSWYGGERDRVELAGCLVVAEPYRMTWGLAADLNQHRFDRAAEDAWHHGLITPDGLAAFLEKHRCRGKNGVTRIERWLERVAGQKRPAQSGLEQEVEEALRRVGLPAPVKQHPVVLPNGELIHFDLAWPDLLLAVEPGSSWFHGGSAGQARDHDRDLACAEIGWMVVRVDETFRFDPPGIARRVKAAYERRLAPPSPFFV
jgi:hypothetical protein